jgi:hypothetical protein
MRDFTAKGQRYMPSKAVMRSALKISAITTAAIVGLALLMTVIFWDANFYIARERWETFKHALFGEWDAVAGNVKAPTHDPEFDPNQWLIESFSHVERIHLFTDKVVDGTLLKVDTGALFYSVSDLLQGTPAHQWCDLTNQSSSVKRRIQIADQWSGSDLTALDFNGVSQDDLALIGIERERLKPLVESHCQFGFFTSEEPINPEQEPTP